MKAIVLVGGEGTRLRPLTYTTPKQLLPVVEVPMLERVLSPLAAYGIDEAVLSLGYRPDAFMARYRQGVVAGVPVSYAVEPEPLDTAGAVRFAADHAGIDSTFVVVNGDVLTDLDIGELVELHRRSSAAGTIALTAVDDPSRFGVVPTTPDGRVEAFVEKPPPGEEPTDRINAGTYVLEPSVLERIPRGRRVSIERETFPLLVAERSLYAFHQAGYWLDTGTPVAYLQAQQDLLTGRRGTPPAPGATVLSEGVWALGTPLIEGQVLPASLVGDGARVEAGASVTSSVIGAGCSIEAGAVIVDSVLLPSVRVCSGARVIGSILGRDCVVGSRAILDGLSMIGDETVIEAGVVLSGARIPSPSA